jgi:hypothetical protein
MFKGGAKGRFMREGDERVYIGEEVIDEEFKDGEWTYGFGVQDGMRGKGCESGSGIVGR